MATINCPHCGKEMYEMLDTCPHCGGPVLSKALEQKVTEDIEEVSARVNQSEKVWLLLSIVAGLLFAFWGVNTISDSFADSYEIYHVPATVTAVFTFVFFAWGVTIAVYGAHYLHIVRRALEFISKYGLIICLLLAIFIFVLVLMACVMTGFVMFPRSILRFITRKPLLSESEVMSLVNKNLV